MIAVLCFVFGLLIGSFLNVVIGRVPVGESIVQPPSHCPRCGTELAWYDNVPVVSWLVLRARCRTCHEPISARYPLVEVGCGALWAALAVRFGAHVELGPYLVVGAGFLALSVIDLDTKRLPDPVVAVTAVLALAGFVVAAAVDDRWASLGRAGGGAVLGFVALLVIHLVRPDGMGFGDVKLAAVCGLALGWLGLAEVIVGLYGGFVLGAVVGVGLMAVGRVRRGVAVPFGPFLAAGTLLTVLVGGPLADWLRGLF
jgi:leader peptidase (prepilin peptidase)/N-methyltransferase